MTDNKGTVLVVDDEAIVRDSLTEWLRNGNYNVVTAADGKSALQSLKQKRIDTAVIDLKMPGMDGIELIKKAKKDYPKIDFIVLTAYGTAESSAEAIKSGATEFLSKPITAAKLEKIIEKLHSNIPIAKTPVKSTPTAMDTFGEERKKFMPLKSLSAQAHVKSFEEYKKHYDRSLKDPEGFWAEMTEKHIDWFKKWPGKVFQWDKKKHTHQWFEGGKLNVSYNCLDRHVKTWRRNKAAIIWEADQPGESRTLTYQQLHTEVCKFANVLKKYGIKKGDMITIYLPMIPELAIAMLSCTRIGAIHNVVFGGFSADALKDRIIDSESKLIITSDASYRGSKVIPLKESADKAVEQIAFVEKMIVVKRVGSNVTMKPGRDFWWNEEMNSSDISAKCEPEWMDAEDPLFILYTSGSTAKPKGVLHTTGGYLTYVAMTYNWIFDIQDEDVYWCTADIGWVTGHSYIVYGPLANAATTLMFEGIPTYPKPNRFWEVCEKYGVTIFYTAPTAIRALMREGDKWTTVNDLNSLRILGTVGEPINPDVWLWYSDNIGKKKCPILDTWWQTETGGILITPLPGAIPLKPGSASLPFPGVDPMVVRQDGTPCKPGESGYLIIKQPWPGCMRTVYKHHERWIETYWKAFPGVYYTGDGCRVDEEGFYWLQGRIDDVINVSGHRLGTAEVESALVSHPKVAETAVVGMPHDIKGQGIYAYVTLKAGIDKNEDLRKELVKHVRIQIGPIATPDVLQFVDGLPKTRSGKIMRRILRKIAEKEFGAIGDITTLADSSVVDKIITGAKEIYKK
jgi:acetyl-CoA synthetase